MRTTTGQRRAVVTGAAGFIGSHLSESLLAGGWHVVGVDAFTDSYPAERKAENLRAATAHPAFELVRGDLRETDLVEVLAGTDTVFHLAGEPGVTGSWGASFARYVERNISTTQHLLEAAVAAQVRRVVYASSSSVVGGPGEGPASPYGISKLAAEHLVGAYSHGRGLDGVSLRYFTVYGPRQRPDMAFARFVDAALLGVPVTVYGDGRQVRDVTYVADVVDATTAAADAAVVPGSVFDIGGGSPVSVLEAIGLLGDLVGVPIEVEHAPSRPGEVRRTSAAIGAARTALEWRPRVDLADGLDRQLRHRRDELGISGVRPGVPTLTA